MALIDDVTAVRDRLAPHGWTDLMSAHGLDLAAADLGAELSRPLPGIDRDLPGFEDFSLEGQRGIEPGHPARSLLFHALASPNVLTTPDGAPLGAFPTLAELDTIENYVYGAGTLDARAVRPGRRRRGSDRGLRPRIPTIHPDTTPKACRRLRFADRGRAGRHRGGAL